MTGSHELPVSQATLAGEHQEREHSWKKMHNSSVRNELMRIANSRWGQPSDPSCIQPSAEPIVPLILEKRKKQNGLERKKRDNSHFLSSLLHVQNQNLGCFNHA